MNRVGIIAIDFGTAFSGYAYSLTLNNQEIQRVKRWKKNSGADTMKTPTCILFNEKEEFMDFGYNARETYYKICKDTNSYFYFKDFKMELYKQKKARDLVISDVNRKPMSAMKVFSAALKFLKDDALKTVDKEMNNMATFLLDFTWVLTVPAIWDTPARQFMREAAVQEGLASEDKLVIALEPEAASLRCTQLSSEDLVTEGAPQEINLFPGTQYIVVDCGGGTIDITVHEVLDGRTLKELHKASGNDKGGRKVDKKFTQCMRTFFCDGLWEEYERDHPREVQQFMEDFMFFKLGYHDHVRQLEFYREFNDLVLQKQKRNQAVFTQMDGMRFHWKPNSNSAKIEISAEKMESFFHETLVHINDSLSNILEEHTDIRYIILVGGLSSSYILQRQIIREFSDRTTVLCPQNPQEAILMGAVMFGRDQSLIRSRKSAYTYGYFGIQRFDFSIHKQEKMFTNAEGTWCSDLFEKMVEINEDVGWDETRHFFFTPIEADQTVMVLEFFKTERKNVVYIDDWGVDGPVALCMVPMLNTARGMDRKVSLQVFFGSTEIKAVATDLETGNTVSAKMDFHSRQ